MFLYECQQFHMSRAKQTWAFGASADSKGSDQTARLSLDTIEFSLQESMDTIECVYQRADEPCHAKDDMKRHIWRMLEGTFSLALLLTR